MGRQVVVCRECNGRGSVEYPGDHPHVAAYISVCKRCDGEGRLVEVSSYTYEKLNAKTFQGPRGIDPNTGAFDHGDEPEL